MEIWSALLVIMEMWIKIIMRYYFMPSRRTVIKDNPQQCWRGRGRNGNTVHCWWNRKMVWVLWKIIWQDFKKGNTVAIWFSNSTPRDILKSPEYKPMQGWGYTLPVFTATWLSTSWPSLPPACCCLGLENSRLGANLMKKQPPQPPLLLI